MLDAPASGAQKDRPDGLRYHQTKWSNKNPKHTKRTRGDLFTQQHQMCNYHEKDSARLLTSYATKTSADAQL